MLGFSLNRFLITEWHVQLYEYLKRIVIGCIYNKTLRFIIH